MAAMHAVAGAAVAGDDSTSSVVAGNSGVVAASSRSVLATSLQLPWGARKERPPPPWAAILGCGSHGGGQPDAGVVTASGGNGGPNELVVRPGEYAVRLLFGALTMQAEQRVSLVLAESLERPLSKSLQRGEDAVFDQLLGALGSVAEHCLPSLLRALFAWYEKQAVEAPLSASQVSAPAAAESPIARFRAESNKSSKEVENRSEHDYLLERRDLAIEFIFCLILIEILKQLPLHPGHEDLVHYIEVLAFKHFKFREGFQQGPNAQNYNLIADLYAEVIGVLAQSRFQSVRKCFMIELKDLRAREPSTYTTQSIISLLMGMKFFRIKMVPIEEFEASFQFMQECAVYFLEVKDKDIKHALAGLFVEILVPVAASVKNEVNVPCLKNFVDSLYSQTLDLCTKKKHSLALFPLVTCLLCVSHKSFFLQNWHCFLAMCLSHLKHRDPKMCRVALESLYRLLWVYMIRVKCESNTATQTRLQSIVNSLFPKGSKAVVPRDTPLNIFVKIIQFIAQERLDFAMKDIVFDLISVGRPIKFILTPERMAIGLRAFLVVADSLQQREGYPPMPRTLGVLPSGSTLRVKKTFIVKALTEDTAKAIGMSQYYYYVRKAFDDILRALDAQFGRPLMMTNIHNSNKEAEDMITADRKPKIDLFRTCVAAVPRLIPDGLRRQELVDLLARLTAHVDEELRALAFQSLQNVVADLPEWREHVVHGFVQFVLRDIGDLPLSSTSSSSPAGSVTTTVNGASSTSQILTAAVSSAAAATGAHLADQALRMLLQLLAAWRNSGNPQPYDASEMRLDAIGNVLHLVEGLCLIVLCQNRLTQRRLAVHILKEVKWLISALLPAPPRSDPPVIDVIEAALPAAVHRLLHHNQVQLPASERVALYTAIHSKQLDLHWLTERSGPFWTGNPSASLQLEVASNGHIAPAVAVVSHSHHHRHQHQYPQQQQSQQQQTNHQPVVPASGVIHARAGPSSSAAAALSVLSAAVSSAGHLHHLQHHHQMGANSASAPGGLVAGSAGQTLSNTGPAVGGAQCAGAAGVLGAANVANSNSGGGSVAVVSNAAGCGAGNTAGGGGSLSCTAVGSGGGGSVSLYQHGPHHHQQQLCGVGSTGSGGPASTGIFQDLSIMDAWCVSLMSFIPDVVKHCPTAVTMSWPIVTSRINALFGHFEMSLVNDNRASLLRTSAVKKTTSERDAQLALWRNYILFACRVAPSNPNVIMRYLSPDLSFSSSPENLPAGRDQSRLSNSGISATNLFKQLVPLLRSEQSDMRSAVVLALGQVNPTAFKDLVDELASHIREALDRKQENLRRRRRRDILRLHLTKLMENLATEGTLAVSPVTRDKDNGGLALFLLEYIDGVRLLFETECFAEKDSGGVANELRHHFCAFLVKLIKSFSIEQRGALLSLEHRRKLFYLFANWCGYLGTPFSERNHNVIEYNPVHLQAMCTILSCGPVFEPPGVCEESVIYSWLDGLLSESNEELNRVGLETVVLLLENNQDVVNVLDWLVDRCYTGETKLADACFKALVTVFSNKEYPCDHYISIINVALLNAGSPRLHNQEIALRLLRVLDNRFFRSPSMCESFDEPLTPDGTKKKPGCQLPSFDERKRSPVLPRLDGTAEQTASVSPSSQGSGSPGQISPRSDRGQQPTVWFKDDLKKPLLLVGFPPSQLQLSRQISRLHPELTMPMFSEITSRFPTGKPAVRANMLHYLLPWLHNMELVDPNLPQRGFEQSSLTAKESRDGREGWGSAEATEMVLNNLFFITTKYGDEHAKEIEELWAALGLCWPSNMRIIVRYLFIMVTLSPSTLLTTCKRIVAYMARAAPDGLVDELMAELQIVETLNAHVERTEAPPFYRLTRKNSSSSNNNSEEEKRIDAEQERGTIHTKRRSAEDGSDGSISSLKSLHRASESDATTATTNENNFLLLCRMAEESRPYKTKEPQPLPMPEYGGYYAPLSQELPVTNIFPNCGFHRCNMAVLLLSHLVASGICIDWSPHIPLLLHVAFLGLDNGKPLVYEHCRHLLLNLLIGVAQHNDDYTVARILLNASTLNLNLGLPSQLFTVIKYNLTESGVEVGSSSIPLTAYTGNPSGDNPFDSAFVSVRAQTTKSSDATSGEATIEDVAKCLIDFLACKTDGPLWACEDITAKVWSVRSSEQLSTFLQHVLFVFKTSLPLARIEERWAQCALQMALSCSSRHYAGRSLQIFRALGVSLDNRMLMEILSRLVETVSEQGEDMQGYVTELMLTLEAAVDALDCPMRVSDLMREVFKPSHQNLSKIKAAPMANHACLHRQQSNCHTRSTSHGASVATAVASSGLVTASGQQKKASGVFVDSLVPSRLAFRGSVGVPMMPPSSSATAEDDHRQGQQVGQLGPSASGAFNHVSGGFQQQATNHSGGAQQQSGAPHGRQLGRSRSALSLRIGAAGGGGVDDLTHEDRTNLLLQMFWIAVSVLDSDYEHEFLLALRLLEKVLVRLPLDNTGCVAKLDKIRSQMKWNNFPGVHNIVLKGCTSPSAYDATINVLCLLTGHLDIAVVDCSQNSLGFPLHVMALLPHLLSNYEQPTAECIWAAENIAQVCVEKGPKLENLATVMTLYSQRTFSKESLQWCKCIVKYLYDAYHDAFLHLVGFLVEMLERGPAGLVQHVLTVLYCILLYLDISGSSTAACLNSDLLKTLYRYVEGIHWKEALRVIKHVVTRCSTLPPNAAGAATAVPAGGLHATAVPPHTQPTPHASDAISLASSALEVADSVQSGKRELPGRTMDFSFDMACAPYIGLKGAPPPAAGAAYATASSSGLVGGGGASNWSALCAPSPRRSLSHAASFNHADSSGSSNHQIGGWRRPWLSQAKTREHLISVLSSCGQRVAALPKSPSVIFSHTSDSHHQSMSMCSSTEEVSANAAANGGSSVAAAAGPGSMQPGPVTDHQRSSADLDANNEFGVFKDFDFLEYELESQEGETIDNFNWGVRRRSLSNLDIDESTAPSSCLAAGTSGLVVVSSGASDSFGQAHMISSAAGEFGTLVASPKMRARRSTSGRDTAPGVTPVGRPMASVCCVNASVGSIDANSSSDEDSMSPAFYEHSDARSMSLVFPSRPSPSRASRASSQSLISEGDATLSNVSPPFSPVLVHATGADDRVLQHLASNSNAPVSGSLDDCEGVWRANVRQLMTAATETSAGASVYRTLGRLLKQCFRKVAELTRAGCEYMSASDGFKKITASFTTILDVLISQAEPPFIHFDPELLASSRALERLKFLALEVQEHFETFLDKKEHALEYLDALRSAAKLEALGEDMSEEIMEETKLDLCRALYRLHFQTLLLVDSYNKVLLHLTTSINHTQIVDLSEEVSAIKAEILRACEDTESDRASPPVPIEVHLLSQPEAENVLVELIMQHRWNKVTKHLHTYRRLFPSLQQQLGFCEDDDVDVILKIYCRHLCEHHRSGYFVATRPDYDMTDVCHKLRELNLQLSSTLHQLEACTGLAAMASGAAAAVGGVSRRTH